LEIKFGLNISDSLPGYFYVTDLSATPEKGDVVLFQPPVNEFFHENLLFMKIVVGSSGDEILVNNRVVYLSGKEIGVVKDESKSGKKLFPIESQIIKKGMFFMWTPHKDSYDSRYNSIGLINENSILGVSHRIF